ncbi:MAG: glycerophosphodiester phosphodiesterase [Solirubrobacterales bacterium]|nr:glycerophosphodiester phosphodiesterase [Solirubrobacterales bacterium]
MTLTRIGHKGADALVPGNTVASFVKAVEVGVDLIEFDVLWLDDGRPESPTDERSPLVVAHDWQAAAANPRLTLDDALAAFTRAPLEKVAINLDVKLPGREDELVEAVRRHGLLDRTTVSTMELSTIGRIGELEPAIERGWTVPRVTRDWTAKPWLRPAVLAGVTAMRRRLPGDVGRRLPELGVQSVWAFQGVVTPRLVETTSAAGVALNVWTVDTAEGIARFREMGVSGVCSNDPRLLQPGGPPA